MSTEKDKKEERQRKLNMLYTTISIVKIDDGEIDITHTMLKRAKVLKLKVLIRPL
jgi:hypothetical protein